MIPVLSKNLKRQVSSDCKPIMHTTNLFYCKKCHCIQKNITPEWEKIVDSIYSSYTVYYQADGSEQLVFIDGHPIPRSHRIIAALLEQAELTEYGRLLDIGCGNGSFLRVFHQYQPKWALSGSEMNDHDRGIIESISGFDTLWCCSPKEISGSYDVISMIHVLEHITSPVLFISDVKKLLSDSGLLLIQTPNYQQNPFDLIVADHATHFSMRTLCDVIEYAGFEILWKSDTWIPKELTLLAKKTISRKEVKEDVPYDEERELRKYLDWLEKIRSQVLLLANDGSLGIFGTSISATWLSSEIPDSRIHFFIEEDPLRIGKMHLGRPVYDPNHAPRNSIIFLPFCPQQAQKIKERLEKNEKYLTFVTPSDFISQKGNYSVI
jgi:SAM-dependent methyltransferase